MQINGNSPLRPYAAQQPQGKKAPPAETEEKVPGRPSQESYTPSRAAQDTYTPSTLSTSLMSAQEVEDTSATDDSIEVGGTTGTPETESDMSITSTKDYNYYLLGKYEGMTEYNITVSDELLQKAMDDEDTAAMLESYISATITAHDEYNGASILCHTETHITDISSTGKVDMESLKVFASDQSYANLFTEKYDYENYTNSIERMLVDNASAGTLSDTEVDILEKVASVFDEAFNGTNDSTGYSNFLNKVLLDAGNITQGVIDDNEKITQDITALKEELTTMLADDSVELSDEVRSALEEALDRCDDLLGGNSPLYDVITQDIPVTFTGKLDKDAYDASRPALSTSVFGEEGSDAALESFKEYMLKSNANLLGMMLTTESTEIEKATALEDFYNDLMEKIQEQREEAEAAAQEDAETPDVTETPETPEASETPDVAENPAEEAVV